MVRILPIEVVEMKTVDLTAPYPRDECLRRLQATVEQEKLRWSIFVGGLRVAGNAPIASKSGVVGKIGDTKIRLHKSISGQNSFQTYLFAQLTDDGGRTRLHCRLGLLPSVVAFIVFWFGFVLFIGLRNSVTANAFGEKSVVEGWWVAPGILASFGAALVLVGRYLARDEEKFLIDFLRQTIDAREGQ